MHKSRLGSGEGPPGPILLIFRPIGRPMIPAAARPSPGRAPILLQQ
jgi:hypothetical protein